MSNQSSAKGNPASHRMSNAALKERRKSAWVRGEKRKEMRFRMQEEAHQRNLGLRKIGEMTPWQQVKDRQRARKAAKAWA